MVADLQLPMQSVPITTNVVSSHPAHGEGYSTQHYVITFVSDLWQVDGFLLVLRFPPPIKLTITKILLKVTLSIITLTSISEKITIFSKYDLTYYSFSLFPLRIFWNIIILCRNQNGEMDGQKIRQDRRVQMDSHKWRLWNCAKHMPILIYHFTLSPAYTI